MEAVAAPSALSPPVEAYISADKYRELSNLPEYADCRSELVEGRIIDMSRPKFLHGYVASKLGRALANHVEPLDVGMVIQSELGYVLVRRPSSRDTVRGIDISYLSKERMPDVVSNEWIEGAPDLAIEVMSPGNTVSDISLKIDQLLDAGAKAVWIVEPITRSVQVHTAQGSRTFREDDTLTGGDILPDFRIEVADIFPS